MLIDSHCHLDYFEQEDVDGVIATASEQGVKHIVSVSTNLQNLPLLFEIAAKYQHIYLTVGVHPSEQITEEPTVEQLVTLSQDEKVIGIGETGLDYHYDYVAPAIQRQRLVTHIQAAKELQKPLVIHTREASKDTLDILQAENADQVGGIMHCFTETWDVAKQALDMNFYISFAGIITFKNAASVREVAKQVPIDKILIETDSPYLAPVPYRGKTNQPAYVHYIATALAELRNMSYEALNRQICANFSELFNIKL